MNNKVVIVGCGNVGMAYAYALLNQKSYVNELILIDKDEDRAVGEAMDLNHGLPFGPTKMIIRKGTYQDCKDAAIIVIAAGANQEKHETRMDLIDKNSVIFKSIIKNIKDSGFDGIYLIATNPLDVMTYLTYLYARVDASKIIGTGTILDTARLRFLLGEKLEINPKNIHAYVMGEHGDSEFIPWSIANVGLENVSKYLTKEEMEQIYLDVKNAAYKIIERKGNTAYGIGMSLVRITNALLGDENTILSVSSYDHINNIFVGGPAIINKKGIKEKIEVKLTSEEQELLNKSVKVIKDAINKIIDDDII